MDSKILLLHCAEGGKKAIKNMVTRFRKLPENCLTFELPCTGGTDEALLLETLESGFDGVLVVGCRRENCKYLTGNLRAENRVQRVRDLLQEAGIKAKTVDIVFVAPDEGKKLSEHLETFYESCHQEVAAS